VKLGKGILIITASINLEPSILGKNREEKVGKLDVKIDYHSSRFFALLFPAVYLIALTIFCIEYIIVPGPEFLILGFLIYAIYNKRTWNFLKAWLPFITIFFSYQALYGIVGTVAQYNLHSGPINLEHELFGQLPTIVLQQAVRMPVLDYAGAVFYSLHFFLPTVFAFILWKKSPNVHWRYTVAFGLCSYTALLTYIVYPVAPPWLAVPNVLRILTGSVDQSIGIPVYRTLFNLLGSDLYAAFPSMHSALPLVIALFAIKLWGKKALPIMILPIGVWFSAVYLGEHYVIDVLGGITYAVAAFAVVEKVLPLVSERVGFLKKHLPQFTSKPEN
jgi:membrane-associated phospholipid phosphatase